MPAPRHFYRIVDPQSAAFLKPEAIWRAYKGLPAPVADPRSPVAPPRPIAPAPPRVAPPAPPVRPRRRTLADRMEAEARSFRPRIEALHTVPDTEELARLEEEMLGFFDQVLDTAERSRGENRQRLLALAQRFERAAAGLEQARDALAEGRSPRTTWPPPGTKSK